MLKCKFCNKEFDPQTYKNSSHAHGAKNLHEVACERKHLRNQQHNQQPSQTGHVPTCTHEWEFLTGANHEEVGAMQAGYKEVCLKCLEVR